jgi:hypothetical protein
MLTTGSYPVRHIVWDNFCSPHPGWTVPPAGWDGWECVYASDVERGKRATRELPSWAKLVTGRMADLDVLRACSQLFAEAMWPDPLLWGGGLQVTEPGGYLNPHLDAALHGKRHGVRRAVQMVCFVHNEWRPEWGGDFLLCDPDGKTIRRIEPLPGRLIVFESCSDLAYHAVERTSEGAAERVTVAMSLLAPARACDVRRRALFLPTRSHATPPPATIPPAP